MPSRAPPRSVREKRIRELERVLGRKTLENEILHEAVKVAHEKTDLAVAFVNRRGFAVKAVASTLGVSRSQLHERLQCRSHPRRCYAKTADGEFLPLIRSLVDEHRPTAIGVSVRFSTASEWPRICRGSTTSASNG